MFWADPQFKVITGVRNPGPVIDRGRTKSIRQDVRMTSPVDHAEGRDRTLADFFAEIEHSGGPSLTADEHRVLAAAGSVPRAALDQMVQIAEDAGMYERTAEPTRTR